MATNPKVRAALAAKTGWSQQTLSANVQRKKNLTLMSTPEAVCVLAYEHGVPVDKFLDADERARVRLLMQHAAPSSAPVPRAAARGKATTERVIRFPGEFKSTNPLLPSAKLTEAKEMAAIFPVLYVLENSIRDLILRVMHDKHGADWWNTQLTSGNANQVKQKALGRMSSQEKRHFWHQRRGSHPIDYVDLPDLGIIIQAKQNDFIPNIIPDREWFLHMMRELEPSRNVVCHMNPLEKGNLDDVRSWARKWENTMKAADAKGAIPAPAPVLK
jgi:hypothetical protein